MLPARFMTRPWALLPLAATFACAAVPSGAPSAPAGGQPIVIGRSYTVTSTVMGDQRQLNVWTPAGYDEGREIYGTIYLLDGALDQDFEHIAGLAQLGALSWTYQPFVVVGIQTKERQHELTPAPSDPRFVTGFPTAGGARAFRRFVLEEVRPFVEARYRTGRRRVVVGESLAGLFVVDTLLEAPEAFDDYIAVSPSLWWDAGAVARGAAAKLAAQGKSDRRLYLATADEGGAMKAGTDLLVEALETTRPEGFTWTWSDRAATETHATIYHGAVLHALRTLYPLPPWEGEMPWWMDVDGVPPPAKAE